MSNRMKAAVFENIGTLTIKEVGIPLIKNADEIILEIEVCSICGTDVHLMKVPPEYEAKPNTIIGHELVGKVVEKGNGVTTLKVGDRVVINPDVYCGLCRYCRKSLFSQCENLVAMGIDVNGGFAEYIKVTERITHKIDNDLPTEIAVFAEPLACVLNGMSKIKVEVGESVLIIGAGPIGLLFTALLKTSGANPIIVSEPSELRQGFAKKYGADFVINPFNINIKKQIRNIIDMGVDIAIDAVGSQINECIGIVRKGGRVLLFGVNSKANTNIKQLEITTKEIQLFGTWLANDKFPQAITILEHNLMDLKPLITHKFKLEEINKGFEVLEKGEGIEVLVYPKKIY